MQLLTCCLLFLLPICCEAKSHSSSQSFSINSKKPAIFVGYTEIEVIGESAVIILNDGSQWEVKNSASNDVVAQINAQWQVGDDIRITMSEKKSRGRFLLKNARTKDTYFVNLLKTVKNAFPITITQLDKNGYVLVTNEGKIWTAGFLGAAEMAEWKVGDVLLINKSEHDDFEDYELINVRKQKSIWANHL